MSTGTSHLFAAVTDQVRRARASSTVVAVVTDAASTASGVAAHLTSEGFTVATLGALTPLEYQRTLARVAAADVDALVISAAMWETWTPPASVTSTAHLEDRRNPAQAAARIVRGPRPGVTYLTRRGCATSTALREKVPA